jgi:hypothetical protein
MAREMIRVDRKVVFLETGVRIQVAPFSISRNPVSLREFEQFCKSTDYRTTAEQRGAKETYKDNRVLRRFAGPSGARFAQKCGIDIHEIEAMCVSFLDASEFCRWSRTRLPTPEEWLAAVVLNWTERFGDDAIEAINEYAMHPEAMKRVGVEWTSMTGSREELLTQDRREVFPLLSPAHGQTTQSRWAVIRSAPQYVLTTDWDQQPAGFVAPVDFSDVLVIFRVCDEGDGGRLDGEEPVGRSEPAG